MGWKVRGPSKRLEERKKAKLAEFAFFLFFAVTVVRHESIVRELQP